MSDVWQAVNGLYFEYCEGINSYDRDRYANVFCIDATYAMNGQPPMVGRDIIRSKVNLENFGIAWLFQVPPRFHILEHTQDTAVVRAYTMEFSKKDGQGTFYLASYLDHCRIEDGAWRFSKREGVVLYWGPADLSGERVLYPAPQRT